MNTKFYFSYSSISKLLYNPWVFYNYYILNNRDDKVSNATTDGKLIHCLLLSEEDFHNQFVVSPDKIPSGPTADLIKTIFKEVSSQEDYDDRKKLEDYKDLILRELVTINLHQKLLTDEQRVDKIITEDNQKYFEFLKEQSKKILVPVEVYNKCFYIKNLLSKHEKVKKLLNLDNNPDLITYNELSLRADDSVNFDKSYGIQGILDNLTIDRINKVITINDIKTTSKTLQEFQSSIDYYKYWLQASIYIMLVSYNKKFFGLDEQDIYNLKFNFITIDKYNQIYCFPVSNETLTSWFSNTQKVFEIVDFHYNFNRYDLPYEYALEKVIL
jgi:hypothetical protein